MITSASVIRRAPPYLPPTYLLTFPLSHRSKTGRGGSSRTTLARRREDVPLPEAPAVRITVPMTRVPVVDADAIAVAGARGPPKHHAARGHERNEEYMEEFDRGYAALQAQSRAGGGGGGGSRPGDEHEPRGGSRGLVAGGSGGGGGGGVVGRAPVVRAGSGGVVARGGGSAKRLDRGDLATEVTRVAKLSKQWGRGPLDPAGMHGAVATPLPSRAVEERALGRLWQRGWEKREESREKRRRERRGSGEERHSSLAMRCCSARGIER